MAWVTITKCTTEEYPAETSALYIISTTETKQSL
jgi:hypothetical protein